MTLASGTKLGPYEIVSPLGAGGMGEVYRAHDSLLGRDVAIKVLRREFVVDPDRLAGASDGKQWLRIQNSGLVVNHAANARNRLRLAKKVSGGPLGKRSFISTNAEPLIQGHQLT